MQAREMSSDNELMARTASSDSTWTTTVTGEVQPGDGSNKWYNTMAQCRGVIGRVSTNNGTFSLPGVGLYPGVNELQVTVTDVSGNTSQQTRTVTRSTSSCAEMFYHNGICSAQGYTAAKSGPSLVRTALGLCRTEERLC